MFISFSERFINGSLQGFPWGGKHKDCHCYISFADYAFKIKKMNNNHCFFKVTNSVLASLILFQTNDKKSEKRFSSLL
jgi:hypothetical protein